MAMIKFYLSLAPIVKCGWDCWLYFVELHLATDRTASHFDFDVETL